jgi:hypothetical protein
MVAQRPERGLHLIDTDRDISGASLLDLVEVLGERDGKLVEAMVPVDLIEREDVAVNQPHVEELKAAILQERTDDSTGQYSAILLAQVPGQAKFLIMDGFHRDAALSEIGERMVFATIRRDATMKDVLDTRILTANMHSAVTFPRVVEWINKAWEDTPWFGKISAAQAFGLASSGGSGKTLGVTPQEAVAIRHWATDKSDRWGMSELTISQNLVLAEKADMDLVHRVRAGKQPGGSPTITQSQLNVIVDGFPGRYTEQNILAELAIKYEYTTAQTRAAVRRLRGCRTLEEVLERTQDRSIGWGSITPVKAIPATPSTPSPRSLHIVETPQQDPVSEASHLPSLTALDAISREARKQFILTEIQLGKVTLENSVLRGNYIVPDEAERQTPPRVTVVDSGRDVWQLLTKRDPKIRVDDFLKRQRETRTELTTRLKTQAKVADRDALPLITLVTDRIVQDLDDGALSYLGEVSPRVYDQLLYRGLIKEIGLRRPIDEAKRNRNGVKRLPPTEVSLDNVIEVYTGLNQGQRRQLTFEGFMGLNAVSTAQLLETRLDEVDKISTTLKARLARSS